ncbi:MAG: phosphate ABC transporter permease PstA [Nitriliruptorales bacterium]|nr:phosphate ABC transporter permease PstA [Nitriliruptorales bacterium]
MLSTVVVALVPLALIIVVVLQQGASALNVDFFTENPPFSVTTRGGGYAPGFVGSLFMVGLAILISVPLGIAASVYLVEYAEHRMVPTVRFFTDVMTGVPSIFVGVFVYAALVRDFALSWGTLPGAVALAILMLPIIVRSGEEILRLVPDDLRNASYALGSRQWQTVMRVVLPTAVPGLTTGTMLAVARAIGETAPLLFTALGAREIVLALTGRPQGAITLQAFEDARTFAEPAQQRGWAGAFSLMAIVLLLTILARFIGRKSTVS